MRCPKCKFISFDDLNNCAKCANDLSALAGELNGTCKEAHLEFFLGPVVQNQNIEGTEFSESQDLPPINQEDINFDDTSTSELGAFSQKGAHAQDIDFDESVEVNREDDISIELGDIMPIDLDQLDLSSVRSEESSEPAVDENQQYDDAATRSIPDDDIDLNLSDEFAKENLELELNESLSDIDLDDTALATGDDTTVLNASSLKAAEDEMVTIDSGDFSADELDSQFDLDDELIAELSETSSGLDVTSSLSDSTGENEATKLSASGEYSASEETLSSLDFGDIDVSDLVTSSDTQVDSNLDSSDSTDQVDFVPDESQFEVEDNQQPNIAADAGDDENVVYNEINKLDLGELDEEELATLDVTDGFEEDNDDTGILDVTTSVEHDQEEDKTATTLEFEISEEEDLPEAELVLDEEESEDHKDDEVPPDLPT